MTPIFVSINRKKENTLQQITIHETIKNVDHITENHLTSKVHDGLHSFIVEWSAKQVDV